MAELILLPKIDKFLEGLEDRTRAKVAIALSILGELGHDIRQPYSKKITKNIFELRAKDDQLVRLFFGYKNGKIFVLHGFIKKTQKTPRNEIEKAERLFRNIDI